MRKFYIAAVFMSCFVFVGLITKAQSGIYESYSILNINGGANIYYDLQAATANPDFNNAALGNFTVGTNTLVLNGAQQKVYKCNTDDIINGRLGYRIYRQSSLPGAFIGSIYLTIVTNPGGTAACGGVNQQWETSSANINILSGLTVGDYYLEVYTTADFTYSTGSGTHYSNNGGSYYKASFSVTPSTNTWIGVNDSYGSDGNWSAGVVPTANSNVIIPVVGSTFYYPVLGSTNSCYNLDIAPGASLTFLAVGKLSVGGSITNTGLLDVSLGTLEFNGSSPQTFSAAVLKDNLIKNLIISNNVSIGGAPNVDTVKVTGTISFGASNKIFNTNNNLTLISNAAGTASLGDLTANGTLTGNAVTGNANVERYISIGRKWRFIAMNTEGSQTIQNSWMEHQAPGTAGPAGYGQWITDPDATQVDGQSLNTAVKFWNGSAYSPITNPTLFDIKSQPAYMTYIRGDRTATHTNTVETETILRTYGMLAQGPKPYSITPGPTAFTVIGNPYASPIDLKKAAITNSGTTFIYLWNQTLPGGMV